MKANLFIILSLLSLNTTAMSDTEKQVLMKVKELGMSLKKELKGAMSRGGPSIALSVCNEKAIPLTKSIQAKNISVGRVSFKNRNPNNKPKEWMKSYMKEFHSGKIKKKFLFVDIKGTRRGFLMPIKTNGLCLKCHGKNINSNLSKEIKNLYPKDRATGYKANEIRGFFWAEFED